MRLVSINLGRGESLLVTGSLRRWSRRLVRAKHRRRFVLLTEMRTGERLALNPNGWQTMEKVASASSPPRRLVRRTEQEHE